VVCVTRFDHDAGDLVGPPILAASRLCAGAGGRSREAASKARLPSKLPAPPGDSQSFRVREFLLSLYDFNRAHHSTVFMLQDVAMEKKCAHNFGRPEIHPQFDGRILRALPVPVRQIDGVE
jgi:hypothetical protein